MTYMLLGLPGHYELEGVRVFHVVLVFGATTLGSERSEPEADPRLVLAYPSLNGVVYQTVYTCLPTVSNRGSTAEPDPETDQIVRSRCLTSSRRA